MIRGNVLKGFASCLFFALSSSVGVKATGREASSEASVGLSGEEVSLSAAQAAQESRDEFAEGPKVDSVTGLVFWVESDAEGRNAIYAFDPVLRKIDQWTRKKLDVGTRVRGFGGRSSFLVHNATLLFSSGADGRVYLQRGRTAEPTPLTDDPNKSYADGAYVPEFNLVFYVMEEREEERQFLVAINVTSGAESVLPTDRGRVSFASPAVSPDNTKLAWIQWRHPDMPWDETKLLVSSLEPGRNSGFLKYMEHSSLLSPSWSPFNELLYAHDATGWSNLYLNTRRNFELSLLTIEQNVQNPFSTLGGRAFDCNPTIGSNEVILATGKHLYRTDTVTLKSRIVRTLYDCIRSPKYGIHGKKIYMLGGNATQRLTLIEVDLDSEESHILIPKPSALPLESISQPLHISFPTADGQQGFGYLYKPKFVNPGLTGSRPSALVGSPPPLILNAKRWPGAESRHALASDIQFFTSRGLAFFDLDARGSSNRGRKYMRQLYGRFGEMDVSDLTSAAGHLSREGHADPSRLVVRGDALGGATALGALAVRPALFKAGTIYGGVSNASALLDECGRCFERGYLDALFGLRPDAASPIRHAGNITAPVLFFHGQHDQVRSHVHSSQPLTCSLPHALTHSLTHSQIRPSEPNDFDASEIARPRNTVHDVSQGRKRKFLVEEQS